jgi:hypothetical protein
LTGLVKNALITGILAPRRRSEHSTKTEEREMNLSQKKKIESKNLLLLASRIPEIGHLSPRQKEASLARLIRKSVPDKSLDADYINEPFFAYIFAKFESGTVADFTDVCTCFKKPTALPSGLSQKRDGRTFEKASSRAL